MAYQQDYLAEDENKPQGQPAGEQTLSAGSSSLDSAAGSGAAGVSSGAGSNAATAQPKGSGFQNLSRYVDANKEQAAGLSGGITSGIQKGVDEANTASQGLSSDVSSQAEKNTVRDQGVLDRLQTSPEQFAAKEWQDAYKKQAGGYQGMSDVSSYQPYQDISNKYKTADTQVKSLDDPYAIKSTIKDNFKSPDRTYTGGENTLDAFLATSGAGADTLNSYKQQYSAANPQAGFKTVTDDLNSKLKTAKDTSDSTKAATEAAYQASLGRLNKGFGDKTSQAAQELSKAQADAADLKARLAKGDASAYQQTGLDANTASYLKSLGYDASNFVSGPTQGRKLGDLASENEVTGYNALLGLSPGMQSQYDFSKSGLSAPEANINKAGIGSATQASGLVGNLGSKLTQQQAARDAEYNKVLNAQNALKSGKASAEDAANAAALGLSAEDYAFALSNNIKDAGTLTKGKSLNLGDIAAESDRSSYGNLLAQLGLSDQRLQDTQNEGSAYNYSGSSTKAAIDALRAKLAAEMVPATYSGATSSQLGQTNITLPGSNNVTYNPGTAGPVVPNTTLEGINFGTDSDILLPF